MSNGAKAITPIESIRITLSGMEPQFKAALPPHIKPERFIRTVMTAIQTNATLVTADKASLLAACMRSAQEGLMPDGREAAIVTYQLKSGIVQAQLIPMVSGIMKKVRNSGDISTWSVNVVKENDYFIYELGDDERIIHRPTLKDRGETVAVYSIVTMKNGEKSREIMSVEEVSSIKSRSRSKNNGPWVTDFDEMAKKTVIRRHSKRLPMSTDLDDFIRQDDNIFDVDSSEKDVPKVESKKSSPRLSSAIDSAKAKPAEKSKEDINREVIDIEPAERVNGGDSDGGEDGTL